MPTLTFTPDNTPPTAVTLASMAQPNVAPTAVGLASMAQPNVAPAQIAYDLTPNNAAPVALTVPQNAMSNAAPSTVPVAGVAPDNTPPTGVALASMAQVNAAPTAVAMASMTGTDDAPQAVAFAPIIPNPSDSNMHTAALNYVGKLTLNQLFGFYKAPANASIKGVQLSAQTAPTGADVIIELVDSNGVSLGKTATLPAGQVYADVQFDTPLNVLGSAIVRAKVSQIGSGNAGGYLTANLVVQLL